MATFGSDAMVIAGSSPYARRGVLWDAFSRWYGKDDARNLVWQAATRTMNPTVRKNLSTLNSSVIRRVRRPNMARSFEATLPNSLAWTCWMRARPMVCLNCRRYPA